MPSPLRFDNGIHLPAASLWLDPHQSRDAAVVTHAHSDHVRRHRHVIATQATASMMRLRGVTGCRYQVLPFGEAIEWNSDFRVTLYPAAHILGSAQVLVERNGRRLLYSGDFKLRKGLTTEAAEVPQADTVIMETTFGLPRYRFPALDEVRERIRSFCRESLEHGRPPVLLCYSLGKGQEVLAALAGFEAPLYLQTDHWQMASLYRSFGVSLPPFQRFQPGQRLDGVLLCASGCRRATWFGRLGAVRTAFISGWAMDFEAARRFRVDAAFPISDHADYDELLEYVRLTGASRIHTVHGFADEFSGELRRRGLWSEPLRAEGPQLRLFDPAELAA